MLWSEGSCVVKRLRIIATNARFEEREVMDDNLLRLIAKAKSSSMSAEQREQQRQSFAYGNAAFENGRITRDTVSKASVELRALNDSTDK